MSSRSAYFVGLVACVALLTAGCKGNSSSNPVTAGTFAISGTVTGASAVTVEVTGVSTTATTTTNAGGGFTFTGLSNGTYTVTPSKASYLLTPLHREVVLNGANATGQDFTAAPTFSITGAVTGATGLIVELTAPGFVTTTSTGGGGTYTFTGIREGTYIVAASRFGHAVTPLFREVIVSGADASVADFTAVALTLHDRLTNDFIDGQLWQTPEYLRTISGGAGRLFVRATGMQSNLTQGLSYTSGLTVNNYPGSRVTTIGAKITVPAPNASRGGSSTIYGGVRLYYQPAADRAFAFPAALQNELIAALELYDSNGTLRVRRRFAHCNDAACATLDGSGITATDPAVPVGWTVSGLNNHTASASAAYDTTYTLTIELNEATGVFTWTVVGGASGSAGLSGTADVATWAGTAGLDMNLASDTSGFLSAQLFARTNDGSVGGGGNGAIAVDFDDVMVGVNGGAAALYDDFATMGSSTAVGFSAAKWRGGPNGAVRAATSGVHLVGSTTSNGTDTITKNTALAAMYPATFSAWQADLTIVEERRLPAGASSAQLGGTYLNDGTAGAANDGTGDIFARVTLETAGASAQIQRCLDPTCNQVTVIANRTLPPAPGHPLGVGTAHTVFTQWDPATHAFAFRLDDGPPLRIVLANVTSPTAPRVPSRYVRANTSAPPSAAAGTQSFIDVKVQNVSTTP